VSVVGLLRRFLTGFTESSPDCCWTNTLLSPFTVFPLFCFFMAISFLTGVSVSIRVLPDLLPPCFFLGGARVNGLMSLGVTTFEGPAEPVGDAQVSTSCA